MAYSDPKQKQEKKQNLRNFGGKNHAERTVSEKATLGRVFLILIKIKVVSFTRDRE